ncbi:MAG: hypothetical protein ACRCZ2_13365 [Fusobacteriaceae bacterium]
MAKSSTTNVAYYFARRKDTGMAGVWFTHCADSMHRCNIIWRLAHRPGHSVYSLPANIDDVRFPVMFLEDNFVATVKEYCKQRDISIAMDLTMKVIQESNPEIKKMP